ncbi:hypothetical protein [Chryseobacterium mulctrae]|uniref:hypothetical protein n=1 Tax=Chryseobacterium mulctrae TaxID=2576777 RepID=UPI0011167D3C|nr:hypothetical protein [Chryseobacterium mulctrae]
MPFDLSDLRKDLVGYINGNKTFFQGALLSGEIFLSKHTKRLTKINGEYGSVVALIGHVVQSYYSKTFTPYDDVKFKEKVLKTFRQKVDFTLDPAEVLGSVYAEMFDEGKNPKDKTVTKEVMKLVIAKIIDDLNYLSVNGKFDASKVGAPVPVFGTSMDGLNEVLTKINAAGNPFYVPGDALTANNTVSVISKFEKDIPSMAKPKVKKIFTSEEDLEEYQEDYDNQFGNRPTYDQSGMVKTRFGKREIVGVPGLTKGTVFATIDNNFLELVDVVENPGQITDVQVNHRVLDMLSEFSLGYDFGFDQYLFLHTADGTKDRGLADPSDHKLWYPSDL